MQNQLINLDYFLRKKYPMSNPKCDEAFQRSIDENPFDGMHINSDLELERLEGRYPCPKCGKSRKYFCYTCYVPVSELEGKLPVVNLPLKIDIIKHKNEIDGKSTAAHAAVLAPADVRVFTYPNIPDYDKNNVVLIFPSYEAVNVDQLFGHNSNNRNDIDVTNLVELPKGHNKTTLMTKKTINTVDSNLHQKETRDLPIDRAIFIDSTWNQSKGIYKDERINTLRCVVLQNRISQFWRHQRGSPRWYLSTIEAIHQFLVEVHLNLWGLSSEYKGLKSCFSDNKVDHFETTLILKNLNSYNGQYDNLLFFFKHMYKLIHTYYDHEMLYAYKRRLL